MSHDDVFKRGGTPQQRAKQPEKRVDAYEEPLDQWAVLRHEVEVDAMKWQDESIRPAWNQRNTEEETASPHSPLDTPNPSPNQVDIVVVGVGGGGMNAVDRMISTHVRGVRFIAMNTDFQVLELSEARQRICLGQHSTKGLGAGGIATIGTRAATESTAEIRAALSGANLVFIAAGLGGGTGTGAAPVVASIARKLGALTIGIVTMPFAFEGSQRRRIAEQGLLELGKEIDALITVPNDRLLSTTERDCSLADAFLLADDVLRQGVQGIAEVINVAGMVNVDFADVRSVLSDAGAALMSIGQGVGRNRAQRAAEQAIAGGFLNVTIRGAQRVLFNISGGEDMTLFEVNEVAEHIGHAIDTTADITFGAVIDPSLHDTIRVTLIAAGMAQPGAPNTPAGRGERPRPVSSPPRSASSLSNTQPAPHGTPTRQGRIEAPAPAKPQAAAPHSAPVEVPPRPRRSLDDLRGIRSMGHRQEAQRGQHPDNDGDGQSDIPPFMRKAP